MRLKLRGSNGYRRAWCNSSLLHVTLWGGCTKSTLSPNINTTGANITSPNTQPHQDTVTTSNMY